jgi:hypothetical protein
MAALSLSSLAPSGASLEQNNPNYISNSPMNLHASSTVNYRPLHIAGRPRRRYMALAILCATALSVSAQINFTSRNIGSVGVSGGYSYDSGTASYSVRGSGADIWGTSDSFHFVYQAVSGDCEIVARVASVQPTDPWAKAGVMIRESANANARNAFMLLSAANGTSFQRRTNAGSSSTSTKYSPPRAPYWVKLVRNGNKFSGYRSDGGSWVLQATATFTMSTNTLIGLAVTSHKNTVLSTGVFDNVVITKLYQPSVTGTAPANGAINVFRDAAINADVALPNTGAGVDDATLDTNTVRLYLTSSGANVPGLVNTTGGGDAIVYQPSVVLAPSANYTFKVTTNVTDGEGQRFLPFTMAFTTGTSTAASNPPSVQFTKMLVYSNAPTTSLTIGPDGKLYGSGLDGIVRRWTIQPNGTLTGLETYTALAGRAIIGMVFDPIAPTVLWLSHNDTVSQQPAPEFTGKISRLYLTGPGFTGVLEDYVVRLPRSAKDHLCNSLAFGPDGFLYLTQGSLTAMGAPDSAWYQREERLLSAAVLRIDPTSTTGLPINVQTADYSGTTGTYDPFAIGAPVTLYATGVRNAYDLVWHSNGYLYAPANGSAAGGNTPGSPVGVTPVVPAVTNVATQDDFLWKIEAGGYYGHPNPVRGEYAMNGANPTAGVDPAEVVASGSRSGYPIGVLPDANFRGFAWNFGRNRSPNGSIEYKSQTFGGLLAGKLLVCEYSGGDDIIALTPGANGNMLSVSQVISSLRDPLDLVENLANGSIYVAEFIGSGTSGQISLLTPVP